MQKKSLIYLAGATLSLLTGQVIQAETPWSSTGVIKSQNQDLTAKLNLALSDNQSLLAVSGLEQFDGLQVEARLTSLLDGSATSTYVLEAAEAGLYQVELDRSQHGAETTRFQVQILVTLSDGRVKTFEPYAFTWPSASPSSASSTSTVLESSTAASASSLAPALSQSLTTSSSTNQKMAPVIQQELQTPGTRGRLSVQNVSEQGFDVVVSDISNPAGATEILVPVWSEVNGQDDVQWYTAIRQKDGSYQVRVQITNHKSSTGRYQVHLYYRQADGTLKGVTTTQTQLPTIQTTGQLSIQNINQAAGTFDVQVTHVSSPLGLQTVYVPVWSETGGQDDIKWYVASKQLDGSYKVTIKMSDHKNQVGNYHIHLYYHQSNGAMMGIASRTVAMLPQAKSGKINFQNINHATGTFDVIISDVFHSAGVKAVQVPIWSDANGQDDIKWYTAIGQPDGTYKVSVSAANHAGSLGKYHVHLYYLINNNTQVGIASSSTQVQVTQPNPSATVQIVNTGLPNGQFDVLISNVYAPLGIKAIQVPVWSNTGGQDDIKWYQAQRQADGTYKATIKPAFHNYHQGLYHVHTYITQNKGTQQLVHVSTQNVAVNLNQKRTVYLDPGHGGKDTGAISQGVYEKNLNIQVAYRVKAKLEQAGYTVKMSRYEDSYVDVATERSRLANQSNSDIFVSIHFNATASKTKISGIETYWYQSASNYPPRINQALHNDDDRLAQSSILANSIHANLLVQTGAVDRGVRRQTFAVLRETALPSVLLELGYMDDAPDLAKAQAAAYQDRLATGISNGILSYYQQFD